MMICVRIEIILQCDTCFRASMFSLIVESLPSEIVNLFLNIVSKSPKDVLPLVDYDWFDRKLLFINFENIFIPSETYCDILVLSSNQYLNPF